MRIENRVVEIEKKMQEGEKLGVGCVVINERNELLLGLRCKATDAPEWGFLGGSVELGESPLEAVIREVKEESNLDVKHLEYIKSGVSGAWTDYLFVCKAFEGDIKVKEDEMSELRFFGMEDIDKLAIYPFSKVSLNTIVEKGIV